MSIMDDLRIVTSIITSGGPRNVSEQRIVQQRLEALAVAIKAQSGDALKTAALRKEVETLGSLVKDLELRLEARDQEVKDLQAKLTAKPKSTAPTRKTRPKKTTTKDTEDDS